MYPDAVQLHVMWMETDRFLDGLAASVREGKAVEEASNFARWLQFSGVLNLLEKNRQPFPLPCNGDELRRKCQDLVQNCAEWTKGGKQPAPRYEASDMTAVLAKLETLTKRVEELSPPSTDTAAAGKPSLHVIQGGVI